MSTRVVDSAEFIASKAQNVFVSETGCRIAAKSIYKAMNEQQYSTETWASHLLNPVEKTASTVDWIFTIDLLNFSFWSDYDDHDTGHPSSQRFSVKYKDAVYTGYWSLVAAINRALEAGTPITSPTFWVSSDFTIEVLRSVFISETEEQVPLLEERFRVLKEAGFVLKNVRQNLIFSAIYANPCQEISMLIFCTSCGPRKEVGLTACEYSGREL